MNISRNKKSIILLVMVIQKVKITSVTQKVMINKTIR